MPLTTQNAADPSALQALRDQPMPTEVLYVPRAEVQSTVAGLTHPPLAIIDYSGQPPRPDHASPVMHIHVELPQLAPQELVEIWKSNSPVQMSRHDNWHLARNDQVLFASVELEDHPERPIEDAAILHYQHLFRLIQEQGYPHLLRMWNYFPAMNEEPGGLERYKQFCVGRHRAFEQRERNFERSLPAASAIGTQSGHKFVIYFLASRLPGVQVENPRQVSAFCYPPLYGPASPSFSRGVACRWADGEQLFLSGTASVVGHETVHQGQVRQQLEETLTNISVLCDHANAGGAFSGSLDNLTGIKVYVRHREHYELIRSVLEARFAGAGPILYVLGDICRADLLLGIEGVFNLR